MKLLIINGEENHEKIEIHINKTAMVIDIKYKLDEILPGYGFSEKYSFRLIHKNILILDYDSINRYRIDENDEIWIGRIKNYLREDDVIIYVFKLGIFCSFEYLVVKKNDTISTIKSIIERIYSDVIDIWNKYGIQMENDQIVTEIDTNEDYKLIVRCDDKEGNEINNTFDECCRIHARDIADRYLFYDKKRDDNKNETTRTILINRVTEIKQMISSKDTNDDKLNENLLDLPTPLLNSRILLLRDMAECIIEILKDQLINSGIKYEDEAGEIFHQYILIAAREALLNFYKFRQNNQNATNISIGSIFIDTLDYFLKYLNDSRNDWRYWQRLWMKQYVLGSFSDDDLNGSKIKNLKIIMKINGKERNRFINIESEKVTDVKKTISKILAIDMKDFFCIKPGGDHKLNDEDKFHDEYIVEIILSMEDIEILRLLGQGGFAKSYLCRDKISNKLFVLKKPIRNDGDLYRDINIYSKLNSSRNITNYFGLFRDGENICIGMEYMSGGSLRSYLNKAKQLSEQEIVRISYEILTQINELHKLGIIHRDIKSDNIVFDEHNHAKLTGFEVSKYTIGLTTKDLLDELKAYVPGTIYYMAPELIKEEPYSEKIDIWSFGMVMVEMVTGKRPFYGLIEFQVIPKIRNCTKYEFEPIFPISTELNQFINSCLNTNPDERPSAEQLMKSELFY